jgi:Acyl-CoA dehydrogenase, C-terminal domain
MMDGPELDLFQRSIRQAVERNTGPALDAALGHLGWPDALAVDPRTAVSVLFAAQGRAGAVSSAIDRVLAYAMGAGLEATVSVVMPPLGSWDPPGRSVGGTLAFRGLSTAAISTSARVLVATADAEPRAATLTLEGSSVQMTPVRGMDPDLGLVEVAGQTANYEPLPTGGTSSWEAAVILGQLAIGHELVGCSRAMLELARDHALERIQFGRAIASFQAVRHRLAESLVAIEAADAVLDAALGDPSPFLASNAKAVAGRGARTTARHCQQVLAGIGFTAEHPFHRYLRRVLVLDQLFGTSRSITESVGADLIRTRHLPAVMPL